MPPADNTPDFDKMTPEEIMAWMESLAKRQGADQGFTTSADMVIPEIDPSTVVIDEPGYVPSEGKMKGKKIETIIPSKSAAPPVVKPAPEPEAPKAAPPPVVQQPAAVAPPPPAQKPPEPEPAASGLSWLESLAADQGGDFPSLDLSSIAADLDLTPAASAPAAEPAATTNPVDWLESLAQGQGVQDVAPAEAEPSTEAANPVSWLETLAKRQGVPTEELTTPADLDISMPEGAAADGPGYTDYTFETPDAGAPKQAESNIPAAAVPAPVADQDPAAWLDALATSQGVSEPKTTERKMTDDEIQKALAKGEVVPHDQMEAWMNRQLEIGAQRDEPEELTAYDPDAPAVKAEIPDWLIEQVGSAPPEDVAVGMTDALSAPPAPLPPSGPAFSDSIIEPPAVVDMPDWLKEETPSSSELENIFAPAIETPAPAAPAAPTPAIEIDPNDPWVEALEMEYAQSKGTGGAPPETIIPPAAPAAPAASLQEAGLQPETELPAGEPEPVPDWLSEVVSEEPEAEAMPGDLPDWLTVPISPTPAVEQPAVAGDMPDWLQSVDVEASEVPAWLTETLGTTTEQTPSVIEPAPVPAPAPVAPVSRPAYSPAPIPAKVLNIDVPATLNAARSAASSNDVDGCLKSYEMLIRANAELDAVVGDLTKLAEKIKTHPPVFRVLGDGLMRQGKLQAALDIYRKALNQL